MGVHPVGQSMQPGAKHCLVKPAAPERIIVSIRNALKLGELTAEVDRLKKRVTGQTTFDDLIGASTAMVQAKRLGERAARSSIPIGTTSRRASDSPIRWIAPLSFARDTASFSDREAWAQAAGTSLLKGSRR